MEDKIVEIIRKVTQCQELNTDSCEDLIETNILDSLAFIELITALEEEFDIEIQPTQVNPDIWRQVKDIVNMVIEKISSSI